MATNINTVVLTGNLTRDPELRTTPGGTVLCNFSIAVNSREKRQGEWQDRVDYFDFTCFGKTAENMNQYMSKGRGVAVSGRLRQERWEKDGQNRSRVTITADNIQFLGGGEGNGGGGQRSSQSDVPADTGGFGTPGTSPQDDDIPF